MAGSAIKPFDPVQYLREEGVGRSLMHFKPLTIFFSQVDHSKAVFYLQTVRA